MKKKVKVALGVVGLAILFGVLAATNLGLDRPSTTFSWGPVETAPVTYISVSNGQWYYTVKEPSGASTFITTLGQCDNLSVGSTITYQFSSTDYSIGTQRIRIISPSGCTPVPF